MANLTKSTTLKDPRLTCKKKRKCGEGVEPVTSAKSATEVTMNNAKKNSHSTTNSDECGRASESSTCVGKKLKTTTNKPYPVKRTKKKVTISTPVNLSNSAEDNVCHYNEENCAELSTVLDE